MGNEAVIQHPGLPQSCPSRSATFRGKRLPLYCLTIVTAACSIVYELAIAQAISLLAANTVVWYSVTIGLYLLGMGGGSFLGGKLASRGNSRPPLVTIELLLTAFGAASIAVLHTGHMVFAYLSAHGSSLLSAAIFFGTAFFWTLVIGVLTGIELPLLIQLGREEMRDDRVNIILGCDYLGSLVGAVLFPLLLLPHATLFTIVFGVAAVNLAAATYIALGERCWNFAFWSRASGGAILGALLVTGFSGSRDIEQYFLQKFYYYFEDADSLETTFSTESAWPSVLRASSPYQKIDLVRGVSEDIGDVLAAAYSSKYSAKEDFPRNRTLYLNGDFQLNTNYEEIYHEYFAHVPIIMSGTVPERILVLGGGDGMLIRELLKHPKVKSIRHIDLDPKLIELARTHPEFVEINEGALNDPRVTTVFSDGYQYLRRSRQTFDAIYIDFPMPADYNLAKLYSREFFHFVRKRIAEHGFAVFDATGIALLTMPDQLGQQAMTPGNDWPIYYNTLRAAGFETIKPYITTLEWRNSQAAPRLRRAGFDDLIRAEFHEIMAAADPMNRPVVYAALEGAWIRQVLAEHVVALQQGFIALAHNDQALSAPYRDLGVPLYVLNERRYHLAFGFRFPRSDTVDSSLVNSIVRPTFPTIPLWSPRLP